jgi:hypothetical protein
VKTDVIGIKVCKSDAMVVDKVFAKLYPPQPEGVYYVSYTNLDEDVKQKVYKHQLALEKDQSDFDSEIQQHSSTV